MGLINSDSVVKVSGDSYSVDGIEIMPSPGNTQYDEVLDWIAAGNVPVPENQSITKEEKLRDVYNCALTEAQKHIPDIEHHSTLAAIGIICSHIDMASASTELKKVKEIAIYKQDRATFIHDDENGDFVHYDPEQDNNWPK